MNRLLIKLVVAFFKWKKSIKKGDEIEKYNF